MESRESLINQIDLLHEEKEHQKIIALIEGQPPAAMDYELTCLLARAYINYAQPYMDSFQEHIKHAVELLRSVEAEGSGGHGSSQRFTAGHLARDGHRLAQRRKGRQADALRDDSGADRAHLRVLPPLDFVPVGGIGLAHARTQIIRHILPVSLAGANSPTLHSEGLDRGCGASASPVMLVTW